MKVNGIFSPPSPGETVDAGGRYLYQRAGRDSGISEDWTRHRRGDGVRVTRATLKSSGRSTALEAVERRNEAGSSNWQIVIGIDDQGAGWHARASYLITPDAVFAERVLGGAAPQYQDLIRPARMIVMPMFHCMIGDAVQQLAAHGGDQALPCLSPLTGPDTAQSEWLSLALHERRARLAGVEDLALTPGAPACECLHFVVEGAAPAERAEYWVDDRGLILRAQSGTGHDAWSCTLQQ